MGISGFHVNGTALVSVGTGTLGQLEVLGYTDNGARLREIENVSEIITDVFGPMTPHDFQNMGMVAQLSVPLIASDRTVLKKILGKGDRTTAGEISTPGLVIGASGYNFRVAIASPADEPWSFPYCILRPGFNVVLATKANPFVVEFFCWPRATYTVTNAKDQVLWTRSLS